VPAKTKAKSPSKGHTRRKNLPARSSAKYFSGRRAEYRTIKLLEDAGFLCVRAAASKGPADVVAIGAGAPLLVQVKRSERGRGITKVEREKLVEIRRQYNCRVLVHVWKPHARSPIMEEIT
jgi:Holliday junction resolvase